MNRLAIIYDHVRWEEKALVNTAKKKGIDLETINSSDLIIDLDNDIDMPDLILQRSVSYFKSLHSTAALEGKGKRVINQLFTSIHAGNKLFTHTLLKNANIPTPRAFIAFTHENALKAMDRLGYPVVLKPTIGSWGRLIALLNDKDAADAVLEDREHMFPIYQIYYIEEFVKRPPRDIRAIVVGEEVVGAIYRYSGVNQWKTNMALGGRAELCEVSKEMEDLCIKASKALKGDIVGVDLMESDEKGLLIHEVNNTTEFKNVARITGVDIPSKMIDYALSLK
ncbi:MAG: lysine biosynthesis protein LysX [Candidatus Nitrosothermus koennekii]|nr:MAG: lysine biosynthesis protein LysX [Candidatus Nitrosothermus koennekii]